MLQTLQTKIAAEGEKEKELYDRYMCYCKTSGGDLAKGIADAETKVPQLNSDIAENEGKLGQLKVDIETHKADRTAAKTAMAEATALRGKEKAKFDSENADLMANLAAIAKAVGALEKGMGGFLQTAAASKLRNFAMDS